jgi:mono/diheme cytochrome c family protein
MFRPGWWALAGWLLAAPWAWAADKPATANMGAGEYIFRASGCYGCHTDEKGGGARLAGGHALKTDFGTFYSPNITPDPETGIGKWGEADFFRAMREGLSPAGDHYYPSFPYPSYTKLTDDDLRALWAYLRAQPAVKQANKPHDLKFFARARTFVGSWKALYFKPGVYAPQAGKSAAWNRGAYLSEAAAHCGECHTPRSALGGIKTAMHYAGSKDGPDGSVIPNITPHKNTGIGKWSRSELMTYLESGLMPDGDSAGDLMAEVIDNGLRYLRKDDLAAMAEYVLSLPPVEHAVRKPKKKEKGEFD